MAMCTSVVGSCGSKAAALCGPLQVQVLKGLALPKSLVSPLPQMTGAVPPFH